MIEVNRHKPYLILGALGIGSYLTIDTSFDILNKASEIGINDIDCASSYGNGNARQIIGLFHKLGGYRFNIWEKIGLEMHKNKSGFYKAKTFYENPKDLQIVIDELLETYQTQKLYCLQLHAPLPDQSRVETLNMLKIEKDKGKFRYLGISNHETFEFHKLKKDCNSLGFEIATNQVHFNVAEQKAKKEIIAYSRLVNIPVVVNRVLARGLLAHLNIENSLRFKVSHKTSIQYKKFDSLYDGIKKILSNVADRPISESAISWALQQKGIGAAIVGVSSVKQIKSAINAVNFPLQDHQLEIIDCEIFKLFGGSVLKLPKTMFDLKY